MPSSQTATEPYTLDELAAFIGFDLPDEVMLAAFDRVVNQLYDTMQREADLKSRLSVAREMLAVFPLHQAYGNKPKMAYDATDLKKPFVAQHEVSDAR